MIILQMQMGMKQVILIEQCRKAYIGSEEEKVPQSIKLDKTSEKVLLGTTSKLIAKVSPDNIKNKRIILQVITKKWLL